MDDFNYYYDSVRKRLDKLEVQVSNLEKAQIGTLNKQISECDAEVRRIDIDLDGAESAIQNLDKGPDKTSSEKSFMAAKERFNKCKMEIEFKRGKGQSHALFGRQLDEEEQERQAPKKIGEMSAQMVIERGDDLYGDAESRMINALGITEASKQVVGAIEVDIKQQEDQIDRIHDKTEDIRSNLKRANKVLDLIYRRYLTDKCISILIILIIIVLIIVIIFGILKKSNVSFPTDSIH